MSNRIQAAELEPDITHQPLPGRLAEIALIFCVFLIAAGDPVPGVNEPHYLCRLKHFWNPTWCEGDLFLDSPDAHGMFVWCFGWVTRWLSLEATAWTGRIVVWTLLAWAWQRLSWRVVAVPIASVLTAALWLLFTWNYNLAGEWVVGGVEAKCFAYVFVLAAISEIIDRRWNIVWVLLGAACAFHALVGGWSAVVSLGIWILDTRGDRIRSFATMLPGLTAGGLLSLLGVIPALALTWNTSPEIVAEANRIYVFERLPHHLALVALWDLDLFDRLVRHGLMIAAIALLTWINRPIPYSEKIVTHFAWGAVVLAVLGLVIEIALRNSPQLAAAVQRFYWYRLSDFAVPMAIAFQVVTLLRTGLVQRKTWAVPFLALAIAWTGWHLIDGLANRWNDPTAPADNKMLDAAAWIDACDWVAANTPPDAVFLTPRLNQSFKWRTGRAEVATRKDIPQDARSMVEWFGRVRAAFYEKEPVDGVHWPAPSIAHLGSQHVAEIARKYNASYAIVDHRRPLEFPVVYWNESYVVYELRQ